VEDAIDLAGDCDSGAGGAAGDGGMRRQGIDAAIIITAGFKESGPRGWSWRKAAEIAARSGIRVSGPTAWASFPPA